MIKVLYNASDDNYMVYGVDEDGYEYALGYISHHEYEDGSAEYEGHCDTRAINFTDQNELKQKLNKMFPSEEVFFSYKHDVASI